VSVRRAAAAEPPAALAYLIVAHHQPVHLGMEDRR
jgi:hypothetical protein